MMQAGARPGPLGLPVPTSPLYRFGLRPKPIVEAGEDVLLEEPFEKEDVLLEELAGSSSSCTVAATARRIDTMVELMMRAVSNSQLPGMAQRNRSRTKLPPLGED